MTSSSMRKSNTLRVAFLGNMNNNHFAVMRYLRDEGFDCELLLFTDEQHHFHPKCDAYTLEFMTWVKRVSWGSEGQLLTIKPKVIQADIDEYDVLIGCGLAPAFLCKAGRSLDIMIPYGHDIWTATKYGMASPHYIAKSISSAYFQRKGLSQAKIVNGSFVSGIYGRRIRQLCSSSLLWEFDIPMVYERQYADPDIGGRTHWFKDFAEIRSNTDLMVVAHGRHVWGKVSEPSVKGNDLLIKGWSLFCHRNPSIKAKLVFIEYGQNVFESKRYIAELGIQESVKWLPQMFRKDLMPGLLMADMVAAEFINSWTGGGVIYEALVAGKPLLMHSIEHKKPTRSKSLYPIYNANTPEQIADRLQEYIDDPECGRKMGIAGQKWYQKNVVEKALAQYTEYFEQRAKVLGKAAR